MDRKPNYLFVFDIETIPDYNSAYNLLNLDPTIKYNNTELSQYLTDYHLQITDGKNGFLRQPFHKIVAISYLYAKIDIYNKHEHYSLKELRSAGKLPYNENSERELVAGFLKMINDYNQPRLISFNGKTFDLPVIKYRAMKYGISGGAYYNADNHFKSYDYKFNTEKHCDLIDALSDFGASARIKLNEACAIFGLPGKTGVDGSQVSSMFAEGKIKEIRDYCETDVLNTYLVYLRYALHTNKLDIDNYNAAINDVISLINTTNTQPLNEFKAEWFKTHTNSYGSGDYNLENFKPFIATNYKK